MLICILIENNVIVSFVLAYEFRKLTYRQEWQVFCNTEKSQKLSTEIENTKNHEKQCSCNLKQTENKTKQKFKKKKISDIFK